MLINILPKKMILGIVSRNISVGKSLYGNSEWAMYLEARKLGVRKSICMELLRSANSSRKQTVSNYGNSPEEHESIEYNVNEIGYEEYLEAFRLNKLNGL